MSKADFQFTPPRERLLGVLASVVIALGVAGAIAIPASQAVDTDALGELIARIEGGR